MNAVFKVVYNEALKVFQVVNEMTRSRGNRASSGFGGGGTACFFCKYIKVSFFRRCGRSYGRRNRGRDARFSRGN